MTEQELFDVKAAMELLGLSPEDLRIMAARKCAHADDMKERPEPPEPKRTANENERDS